MIMTKKIFILAITSLLALCHVQQAAAKYIREYTTEKPLIIVSDWEFPPMSSETTWVNLMATMLRY